MLIERFCLAKQKIRVHWFWAFKFALQLCCPCSLIFKVVLIVLILSMSRDRVWTKELFSVRNYGKIFLAISRNRNQILRKRIRGCEGWEKMKRKSKKGVALANNYTPFITVPFSLAWHYLFYFFFFLGRFFKRMAKMLKIPLNLGV